MKFYRAERVGSLIRQELNIIILRELDFGDVLVTLTDVEVAKDLSRAVVKFSALPTDEAPEILKIFKENRKRLHHMLYKKINIRPMPYIDFEIDLGPEKAANIEKSLLKSDNSE